MMQLDNISLPDDLQWINEFEAPQVAQSQGRTLSGAMVVQHASHLYGRPIHLLGGGDGAWITRATALALHAKEASPGLVMSLLDLPGHAGETISVIFDRSRGAALEAQMIMRYAYPDDQTWYSCALRLLTVATP